MLYVIISYMSHDLCLPHFVLHISLKIYLVTNIVSFNHSYVVHSQIVRQILLSANVSKFGLKELAALAR